MSGNEQEGAEWPPEPPQWRKPRKRAGERYLEALTWAIDATKHPRPPASLVKAAHKFLNVTGQLYDELRFAGGAEGQTIAPLLVRVFGADYVADDLIWELKALTKGRGHISQMPTASELGRVDGADAEAARTL